MNKGQETDRKVRRKFSFDEVRKMREEYSKGRVTMAELGRTRGVTKQTISLLLRGETYTDPRWGRRDFCHLRRRPWIVAPGQENAVWIYYLRHYVPLSKIAGHFGIPLSVVRRIIKKCLAEKRPGVPGGLPPDLPRISYSRHTVPEVIRILKLKGKMAPKKVARRFKVPVGVVHKIWRGAVWGWVRPEMTRVVE